MNGHDGKALRNWKGTTNGIVLSNLYISSILTQLSSLINICLRFKPRLPSASSKTAIFYLIFYCNLLFEMSEKKSFNTLLRLCDQETTSMIVKEDAISWNLRDIFLFHQ